MGHSTKPKFFSENIFESVQILEQLLTEITEVCAISHKKRQLRSRKMSGQMLQCCLEEASRAEVNSGSLTPELHPLELTAPLVILIFVNFVPSLETSVLFEKLIMQFLLPMSPLFHLLCLPITSAHLSQK